MRYFDQNPHTALQQRLALPKIKEQYVLLFLSATAMLLFLAKVLGVNIIDVYSSFIAALTVAGIAVIGYRYVIRYALALKLENEQLKQQISHQASIIEASQKQFEDLAHLMSHGMKEPLRGIAGFTCLIDKKLKRNGYADQEITEYVTHINNGIHQLDTLIKHVRTYLTLNFSKCENSDVFMQRVIAKVTANANSLNNAQPVKVVVHQLKNVSGNREMLEELFAQLFSNAVKYRSPDLPPLITIGCRESKDQIEYYVQDNGIGICKKYYNVIFHAFSCLHSKLKYEGAGVGLAMCKKIVHLHGGNIWVKSNEAGGSTFYFTLPKTGAYRVT